MKSQATRYTQEELAYLAYWEARGYRFKKGEKPPMNTVTPPSLAVSHPVVDAFAGAFIMAFVFYMLYEWLLAGARLNG